MENDQEQKKPDKGGLIIIGIIAVIIIAVIICFVVQGSSSSGSGGTAAQPPEDMGELLELNDLNIHGSWFRDEADGSSYEIRFSADSVLHFYMYDAEGNTVAESEEGTYSTENGKLYLSITSKGEVISDVCTAMVSVNVLFISADEGSGLFNGTYYSEYQVPDDLFGDNSESEDESDSQSETSATEPTTDTTTTEATTTTTITTTTTAATEAPAPAVYHLPDIVDKLFSMTAEEYFGGNVPLYADEYLIGVAEYTEHIDNYNVILSYNAETAIGGEIPLVYGFGYPRALGFHIAELVPGLDSYSFYGLQKVFDNIYADNAMYGGYNIYAEADGYTVMFEADTLDEELDCCHIHRQ